jgi:hypothetical protein
MSNTQVIFQNGAPSPIGPTFFTGTAQTTGATTANINTLIPLPTANSTVSIRVNIAGYDKTANLCLGGELIASVRNTAGVLTILNNEDLTKNNDNPLSDWTSKLVNTGTNVQIQVKGTGSGGGADVINWTVVADIVIATAAQA